MSNVKERVEEFWIANSCNARVAADYNKFMGAVDQHGALRASASCSQMSMKWWHTLFWRMLDAAMVNAYCVYAFAEKKAGARSVMHFQQVRNICSRAYGGHIDAMKSVLSTFQHLPSHFYSELREQLYEFLLKATCERLNITRIVLRGFGNFLKDFVKILSLIHI